MLWARHSRPREFAVGLTAIFISLIFIVAGGLIFKKVDFNIFPPTKDTNTIAVSLTYPAGTTIQQAQTIADLVDTKVKQIVGPNFVEASYYGMANPQMATLNVNLTPYSQRDVTAPQLVDKLKNEFKDFRAAHVSAYQIDVGPPASGFAVNIDATDRAKAFRLANDMATYMRHAELKRPSGEFAKITDATASDPAIYRRSGTEPVIDVNISFEDTDITTLTNLAKQKINRQFDADKLASYGLKADAISYDLGQEDENQESFKSLALAFPIVLAVIYILLALQFRSLLQPLLIFMALPFSFFGIALGLYLTDNPFSFFAMLGFFALIGLSIKNTILLTDYANQARRSGLSPVDSAVAALGERFRPLVATSLTAVVSLIPLALASPFWEGLAVVLIFGLLSSTLLVVTVFPYYYLGAEYLRLRFRRRNRSKKQELRSKVRF
jgi:multidrug efflux pump subunit AcrB